MALTTDSTIRLAAPPQAHTSPRTGASRFFAAETPPPADPGGTPGVDDMPGIEPITGVDQHAGRAWEHTQMIVSDHFRETVVERPITTAAYLGGADVALAAAVTFAKNRDVPMTSGQFARNVGQEALLPNGLRITPTLAAGILGPAVADGVSYLAPNLIPKYKKSMSEGEKSAVQVKRAVVGGATVALLAGVVYLVKPQLFKSFGGNLISDKAVQGFTKVRDAAGTVHPLVGVVDDLPRGATVLKRGAPMVQDAVFSHRVALGLIGGGATAYLGNRALMADPEDRAKWGVAAAAAGVATLGGIGAMRHLTRSAANINGVLPDSALFWKPNKQFFKELALKVMVPTGGVAGGAAFNYFDIFSDFDKIVDARSPYRK